MSNNCIPKMMSFSTDQLINILKSYHSRSVSQPPLLALDQHMPLFNSKYSVVVFKNVKQSNQIKIVTTKKRGRGALSQRKDALGLFTNISLVSIKTKTVSVNLCNQ